MIIKRILLSLFIACFCASSNGAITRRTSCPDLQQESLKKALMATLSLRGKKIIHDNFGFLSLPEINRIHSCPNLQDLPEINRIHSCPNLQDRQSQNKILPAKKVSTITLAKHTIVAHKIPCNCAFQKDYFEEARTLAFSFKKATPLFQGIICEESSPLQVKIDNKGDYVQAYRLLKDSFDYLNQSFISLDQKKYAFIWIKDEANEWLLKNTPNKRNFILISLRANEHLRKINERLRKIDALNEHLRTLIALEDVD